MRATLPRISATISWPIERFGGRERTLVGDDRTIVVAHRVVDRRDRVQDVAGVDAVGTIDRGLVGVERAQAVLERFREVGRLVVDDAEQVDGPRVDERRRHRTRATSLASIARPNASSGSPLKWAMLASRYSASASPGRSRVGARDDPRLQARTHGRPRGCCPAHEQPVRAAHEPPGTRRVCCR